MRVCNFLLILPAQLAIARAACLIYWWSRMAHINTSLDTLALDNTAVYTQALKNTDAACYRNVYTYTHKNTHTIIRMQPAIEMHTHTLTRTHIQLLKRSWQAHADTRAHTHTCTHTFKYTHIQACTRINTLTHTYIHTHTHPHLQTHTPARTAHLVRAGPHWRHLPHK